MPYCAGNKIEQTYSTVTQNGPVPPGPVPLTQASAHPPLATLFPYTTLFRSADSTSTSECFHLSASPTIDTNQTPVTGNVGDPISDSASLHNTSNLDEMGRAKI